MDISEVYVSALPVQLVDLPDGILVRRGATQLRIAGGGLRLVLELIFALACADSTSKSEIRDLVLPRFPDLTPDAIDALFDSLLSSRMLQPCGGPGRTLPSDDSPAIQLFRWDCGLTDARALASAHVVILGVNRIARSLRSALASCGVRRITVIDDPQLRSANVSLETAASDDPAPLDYDSAAETLGSTTDLLVATSDLGNQQAFRAWNELAVKRGIAFLPVLLADHKSVRSAPWCSPAMVPASNACARARTPTSITPRHCVPLSRPAICIRTRSASCRRCRTCWAASPRSKR